MPLPNCHKEAHFVRVSIRRHSKNVGGTNYFNNGDGFFAASQFQLNGGTTILTNGGWISTAITELWFAQGAGSTSTVVVAGGYLVSSNTWLCVGRSDATANGTLIVNGGQVLDNNEMLLGESPSSVANLHLNGGLIQATDIKLNNNGGFPTTPSVACLNGGTLRVNTNIADFIQVTSQVMSNGFTLDDNGYSGGIVSQPFQAGDALNGGLIKTGSGVVYLDSASTCTGTTRVTNGLLAGSGSVTGPVIVAPAGKIGAGDAAGNGTFTVNNNLTIQGDALIRINKTGGTLSQDQVFVTGNITFGGVLNVSNITSDATVLVAGDTFPLFSVSGTKTGNFASINLGNWSDTTKWTRACPANGVGLTADFSALDITANRTVTLDSSRSLGALKFRDLAGAQAWTVASSGGSVLTLDTTLAASPSIVVGSSTTKLRTLPRAAVGRSVIGSRPARRARKRFMWTATPTP